MESAKRDREMNGAAGIERERDRWGIQRETERTGAIDIEIVKERAR